MSIKVVIEKLTPRKDDLPDQIKVEKLNEMAEDFGAEVANMLGKLACRQHPEKVSRIIIAADRKQSMVIRKKCCCRSFDKLISAKFER